MEDAKKLGALWDDVSSAWCVLPGVDLEPFRLAGWTNLLRNATSTKALSFKPDGRAESPERDVAEAAFAGIHGSACLPWQEGRRRMKKRRKQE